MSTDDELRLCADAFITHLGYISARNKIDRLCKLFNAAQEILWKRDSYPAQFDAVCEAAVAKYGEDVVNQQLDAAHATLKKDRGMKPRTVMWFVLALVFAKNPMESFIDDDDVVISHGEDIDAQVYHLTRGTNEAWDDNLRILPGLTQLARAKDVVNSLYVTINMLASTSIESLIS
jgi:hypothetical protein